MFPTGINPLPCNNVDSRLLLVTNMDSLNYWPSKYIYFPSNDLCLLKEEIMAHDGKMVWDSVDISGIQLNGRKISPTRSILFRCLPTGHWFNEMGGVPNIFCRFSFAMKVARSGCRFKNIVDIYFLFEDLKHLCRLMVVGRIKCLEESMDAYSSKISSSCTAGCFPSELCAFILIICWMDTSGNPLSKKLQ